MTALVLGITLGAVAAFGVAAVAAMGVLRKLVALERRAAETERLAELGLLTAGLAHEIKNPLSTLGLNLQLLQEDLEARVAAVPGNAAARTSPEARMLRRLTSVSGEAARLREILDDFLRYAGRLEVEKQPTDLGALVEELVDFLSPQAHVAKVRIISPDAGALPPEAQRAQVDTKLLKQALLNLLLNAIQHTPAGGTVRIGVSVEGPGRRSTAGRLRHKALLRIDVSDTGRGIEPDQFERVFEPYYSRRKGGTGLGLPMTRRIVHAHGGELDLHSVVGEGSRFSILLPME